MERTDLGITGMTCAACAARVERALRKMGVQARVNLGTETARVWAVPAGVTLDDLRRAVESAGYGVREGGQAEGRRDEWRRLRRQWIAGLAAGLFLMVLMVFHPPLPIPLSWLMAAVAVPVLAWTAGPIFAAAGRALRSGALTMEVMYALGIGASLAASLLATLEFLPEREFLFYDTAVFLAAFLALGRWLEGRARGRTDEALRAMADLQPPEARILRGGRPEAVPAEAVVPGDLLLVRPGDRVPVDGRLVEGKGFVDESLLTGESLPVPKGLGDPLFAGTLDADAVLTMEAVGVGRDTVLAGILRMMEEAQGSRAPLQRLADRARPEAGATAAALRAAGLKVVMLTGDNPRAARAAAAETGVDEVMAALKPAEKAAAIAALQARGERVAFAGDGINDAVALACADVGIAMGGGADAAREGADIVLMRDDLRGVPAALKLSGAIVRRIRWNLFWAAAWNLSLIPLAAGVLYPAFRITLPPSLAALAMAFSSVTVVTLSLSLRRFRP